MATSFGVPATGSAVRQSDPALVERCIDGDESAWHELVERYVRLIYSVALKTGISAADADDVVQNVCLILLRRLPALRDHTRLTAWLVTTTRRECWQFKRRLPDHDGLEETVAGEESPDNDVLSWERQQMVHEALGRIDDRCRQLLTALFLDPAEPSYELIAQRLGLPLGSVGPTRARCFRKLEQALQDLGFDGAL